jgi:spermidine synthase
MLNGACLTPWLFFLFLCSGCAALIYEVVWLQLLQLVIGLNTISLGLLLAAFMGGMCLGSLLLSRMIPRRYHPLRVYGLLELGIGILGIVLLFALPWIGQYYGAFGGSGIGGIWRRGAVAGICLLPPTVLMGATLPAMARWVEMTPRGVSWLGFFYAGNIIGAVLGCLLAGFYLLRVYNMAVATYVAAAINGLVMLLAFGLSWVTPHTGSLDRSPVEQTRGGLDEWRIYVAIGLSGLTALGAEVVWTRSLSLLLGATVYTFSIILAVFLVGLGLGSSAGAALSRLTARPRTALAWCQVLAMGGTAWTAWIVARSLPGWPINPTLAQSPWPIFQMDIARCWWALLPAPLFWGASFPLALAGVARLGQDPGRLVGRVYTANTVGAILGALLFSLWIVPAAGGQGAERLLIGLSASAALILWWQVLRFKQSDSEAEPVQDHSMAAWRWLSLALVIGLAAVIIWSMPAMPWGMAAYGRFVATYGHRLAPGVVDSSQIPKSTGEPDIFCTYLGEGIQGTVAVTQWKSGVRCFHSAGKVQASSDAHDMRLQRLLGHLAALVHPKPESVLVVACGAGVTAGSFVPHPSVRQIVICEIEPLVPQRVAPMFEKENYSVVKDPRTRIVLDDGRHYLRTTREQFDIITSLRIR